MQQYWIGTGESAREVSLPPAEDDVLPGIKWGRADMLDTAAYWALQCHAEDNPLHGFTSSNGSLLDEIGFCLLGGFGITAELNIAAFDRLADANAFDLSRAMSEDDIRQLLSEPLLVEGSFRRYRFPNQRAVRLCAMRRRLTGLQLDELGILEVRTILRQIDGIGPKTAAWIIRNHFGSDDVAILDIHVIRACSRLSLFPAEVRLPRDYEPLEQLFISFARAMNVRPAVLDAVMWIDMRQVRQSTPRLALH